MSQYLLNYAEPEARSIDLNIRCEHVVVIPCFAEENLQATLASLPGDNQLAIVVVNSKVTSSNDVRELNSKTLAHIKNTYPNCGEALFQTPFGKLLVLHRDDFPKKQGVGLARKIGCDVAMALIHQGQVTSPWIFTTDADARVPQDYFVRPKDLKAGAALFPFWHVLCDEAHLAYVAQVYEMSLHYYVLGLRYAGSPYAFHTVGSSIAVHAKTYEQVRGFPKREAAEDFYLLDKIAKTAPVTQMSGKPLELLGRRSNRVPFGTGHALSQPEEKLFYHPACFDYLKAFLAAVRQFAHEPNDLETLLEIHCQQFRLSATLLQAAVQPLQIIEALTHAAKQAKTSENRLRYLHTCCDGLKTLQLIHRLRDLVFASLPWQKALQQTTFVTTPDLSIENCRMALARSVW
jgi:hypothetical protein